MLSIQKEGLENGRKQALRDSPIKMDYSHNLSQNVAVGARKLDSRHQRMREDIYLKQSLVAKN